MRLDTLKEVLRNIGWALRLPIKEVFKASVYVQHRSITLLFLALGWGACSACLHFILPLELAIGLGVLCLLAAWSLIPLGLKIVLPRRMHSKRMLAFPNWIVAQGLTFFVGFVGIGCGLWFAPWVWPVWLIFLPIVILTAGLCIGLYSSDHQLGKKLFYYFDSIYFSLIPAERARWEKRAEVLTTLELIAEIADNSFARRLVAGTADPIPGRNTFYWYRRLDFVCKTEDPRWEEDQHNALRMLLRIRLGILYTEGSGGLARNLQEASSLFNEVITYCRYYVPIDKYRVFNGHYYRSLFAQYKQQAQAELKKLGKEQAKEDKVAFLTTMKRSAKEPIQAGFPVFPPLPVSESSQEEKVASSDLTEPPCPLIQVKPAGQPVDPDFYDLSPFKLIFEMAGLSEPALKVAQEAEGNPYEKTNLAFSKV